MAETQSAPAPTSPPARPERLALTVKGSDPERIVAYACPTCRFVLGPEPDIDCRSCDPHRHCSAGCGVMLPAGRYGQCDACYARQRVQSDAQEAAKRDALYAKAEKVPYSMYAGEMLFWWGGGGQEGYYRDVGELLDYCGDEGIDPPAWVWATAPLQVSLSAEAILDSACDDAYEGARDSIPRSAEKELQDLLTAWSKQHGPVSYWEDNHVAVDISAEVAAWRAERAEKSDQQGDQS